MQHRGCSSLCCTSRAVGAILAWLVHHRGCSSLWCTNRAVGAILAWLVHFLLWQAAKPSGDKCTTYELLVQFLLGWCT